MTIFTCNTFFNEIEYYYGKFEDDCFQFYNSRSKNWKTGYKTENNDRLTMYPIILMYL